VIHHSRLIFSRFFQDDFTNHTFLCTIDAQSNKVEEQRFLTSSHKGNYKQMKQLGTRRIKSLRAFYSAHLNVTSYSYDLMLQHMSLPHFEQGPTQTTMACVVEPAC